MNVRLWFIRETDKARLFSRLPPERKPGKQDEIWIPRSVIEHQLKFATGECHLKVTDWFAEKNNL